MSLPPLTRIAVIGSGGQSGIVALEQLLEKGAPRSAIVGFEARKDIGGVWHYDPDPGECEISFGPDGSATLRARQPEASTPSFLGPTPIYDQLHTNIPKIGMALRGNPFPEGAPAFPDRQQALEYLRTYASNHNLLPLIRFSTWVKAVYHTPSPTSDAERWTVETESALPTGERVAMTEYFSHIIVTNGHFNEPFIPVVPGLRKWKGEILHSMYWRHPKLYANKSILVIGSRFSGCDIASQLAISDSTTPPTTPRRIYQSVRNLKHKAAVGELPWSDPEGQPWSRLISVVPELERVEENAVYSVDGSKVEGIDVILFATGYRYSYPFFPSTKAPFNQYPITVPLGSNTAPPPPSDPTHPAPDSISPTLPQTLQNLHPSDVFYAPDPTLSFIGLWTAVNIWPNSEITARLIAHTYLSSRSPRTVPKLEPLKRASENPGDLNIGAPMEFENADMFLRAIGEGVEESEADEKRWCRMEEERIEARLGAKELRKRLLGY